MSSIWAELVDNFLTLDTAVFVVNTGVLGLIYGSCSSQYKNYEAVFTARQLEINEHLAQTLREDYPNGTCVHAIVRGQVQATEELLSARMIPNEKGVIHRFSTIEHLVKWNNISRFWTHEKRTIHDRIENVPFGLTPLHEKGPLVLIEDPLQSNILPLRAVYDRFTPSSGGVSSGILGWIQGERSEGFQERESLLKEGSAVLAFGTLRHEENGALILEPPIDGASYVLTNESHKQLVDRLKGGYNTTRAFCVIFGVTSLALGSYILYRLFKKYRRRYQEWLDSSSREEVRSKRRRDTRTAIEGEPQCVICLSNIVEVMLLECGHLCLCTDCCDQLTDERCPICRAVYTRRVAARLP